jgi:arabinose-5-phosphate isomerase
MKVIEDFRTAGIKLIQQELEELHDLEHNLDEQFNIACQELLSCTGKIIVTGIGKSGHIGRKIAATLSSTGTPAYFVHPAEACHGDFGVITHEDKIIMISYSGEASEIITLLPMIKRLGITTISISGSANSTLGKQSDIFLNINVKSEACPLGLAPTSSTTKTLVLGDALAIAILSARGFSKRDFAFSHPGGKLGRRLLLTVDDIMHKDTKMPIVKSNYNIEETLIEMSTKGFGMAGIIDENSKKLIGIYTDGDLRRTLEKQQNLKQKITTVMTTSYKHTNKESLAATAMSLLEKNKISALFVVNEDNTPVGIIHLHDLVQAKIV